MSTAAQTKERRSKKKKRNKRATTLAGALAAALDTTSPAGADAFAEWANYLGDRKSPTPLRKLFSAKSAPLAWCVPVEIPGQDAPEVSLLQFLHQNPKSTDDARVVFAADHWLALEQPPATVAEALVANLWCHLLPGAATVLRRSMWNAIYGRLVEWALAADQQRGIEDPWAAQLVLSELPAALAYQFPEIARCRELAKTSASRLKENIPQLLDGQGMTSAAHLQWMQVLLASWTRSLKMLQSVRGVHVASSIKDDLDWMLRQTLRAQRSDHTLLLSSADSLANPLSVDEALRATLDLTQDVENKRLIKYLLKGKQVADRRLPKHASYHSEWAQLAFLQPDWDRSAPRLAVDFSKPITRLELLNRDTTLLSTSLDAKMNIANQPLTLQQGEWDVVCWFEDEDVDYLELEWQFPNGWLIHRQFLLARQDHFLFFADNLIGPESTDISYQLSLPVVDSIKLKANDESREITLQERKQPLGLVLPLSLPEWRDDTRVGELTAEDHSLNVRQSVHGTAMCMPLFIDLHRNRMHKPMTWRQLTVAEHLQIVPNDTAVGFRVHVGPEQWVFYRALRSIGNRTLIGQNTSADFFCCRFLSDGDTETLIEVE